MKINNALKRLIEESMEEAKAASTDYATLRSLFRHALRRKTRLSMAQATWIWHNHVPHINLLCHVAMCKQEDITGFASLKEKHAFLIAQGICPNCGGKIINNNPTFCENSAKAPDADDEGPFCNFEQ